jgi:predicted dinucleotide-binding enzyme
VEPVGLDLHLIEEWGLTVKGGQMRIGILGAGNVGAALGRVWTSEGHDVLFGVPDAKSEKIRKALAALGSAGRAGTNAEAAAFGEVLALAVPWPAVRQAIESSGNLAGKVLIDCTNPLASDLKGLTVGLNTSAGEQVAAWVPGALVVKAFNTLGAGNFGRAEFAGQTADGFFCGDDAGAKAIVKSLIADAGLNPVDVGPLRNARWLEPIAMLWIDLAVNQGWGGNHAFKLLRRSE